MRCDAGIIPVVLGSDGEILDMGRTQRLFTSGQVKALWLRDPHCTFTGCDARAHWCHAHHLWHWIDGGPTDLANAALLCGRHHTIVHRDQLAGTVVDGQVLWDRRPGSSQRLSTTSAA
ncbi:MAG: HNH endonuclease signature motif containing protein [Nakamurella sp.]